VGIIVLATQPNAVQRADRDVNSNPAIFVGCKDREESLLNWRMLEKDKTR
jgi:hypothetical protein